MGLNLYWTQLGGLKFELRTKNLSLEMLTKMIYLFQISRHVPGIMKKMNDQNKSAELMKTLEEFSKQNQMMEMKDELINETLEEALADSGDEEEEEAIMQKVLDDIGIEITGKLADAKSAKVEKQSTKPEITDDYIEKELAKLRM